MAHAAEPLDRAKISAPEKNKNGKLFRGDERVWLLSFDSLLLGIPFPSHGPTFPLLIPRLQG